MGATDVGSWDRCSGRSSVDALKMTDTGPHSGGEAMGSPDGAWWLTPTPCNQQPSTSLEHSLYLCLAKFSRGQCVRLVCSLLL